MKKYQAYARLEKWALLEVEAKNTEEAYAKLRAKFNKLTKDDYSDEDEIFLEDTLIEY